MSKTEIISRLMDEMSSQNDWYLAAIGILITLTLFVSGFSIYAQLKLSDKQIAKLRASIKGELIKEYSLNSIGKVKDTDNTLTDLILTNLRSITNRLMLDSESYTTLFLIDYLTNLVGYLELLKNRKIDNADFIDAISNVLVMIDAWSHRSDKNEILDPVQAYIYRIYIDIINKDYWEKVKDYNHAVKDFKDKIRTLTAFKYLNFNNM